MYLKGSLYFCFFGNPWIVRHKTQHLSYFRQQIFPCSYYTPPIFYYSKAYLISFVAICIYGHYTCVCLPLKVFPFLLYPITILWYMVCYRFSLLVCLECHIHFASLQRDFLFRVFLIQSKPSFSPPIFQIRLTFNHGVQSFQCVAKEDTTFWDCRNILSKNWSLKKKILMFASLDGLFPNQRFVICTLFHNL